MVEIRPPDRLLPADRDGFLDGGQRVLAPTQVPEQDRQVVQRRGQVGPERVRAGRGQLPVEAGGFFDGDQRVRALPKATALTTYSYRLEHSRQAAFLAALDKAALAAGLADGEALNLDFHAVMHWGDDPVLEKHYVPRRSQRTRSVLTFFAEDAGTHTLLYANADLSKASQNREVIAFADHWNRVTGHDPALLIFDSKLTTQAVLAELDDREHRVHHPARPPPRHHQGPGRPARQAPGHP